MNQLKASSTCLPARVASITSISRLNFSYLPRTRSETRDWLLHINLVHLIANVGALGLLSVYERRVGAKRFTAVLLAGCIAAALSAFFYSDSTRLCGISGGLFALAAAYFVDNKGMPTKDWLKAILFFVFIVGLLMIDSELRTSWKYQDGFRIDHLGHVLGAIGGITYCRLRPLRS